MPELGKSVIKECDNKQGDITQSTKSTLLII